MAAAATAFRVIFFARFKPASFPVGPKWGAMILRKTKRKPCRTDGMAREMPRSSKMEAANIVDVAWKSVDSPKK